MPRCAGRGGWRIYGEALKAWQALCFGDIYPKLGSQEWVRSLDRFWGCFGVSFGRLWGTFGRPWESLWAHFWAPWGHFGLTLAVLGSFGGTLGVPFGFGAPLGRLLGTFLDTLSTFIVFSLDILGFPQVFLWYSFEFPCYSVLQLFLRYSVFIPLVFSRYPMLCNVSLEFLYYSFHSCTS